MDEVNSSDRDRLKAYYVLCLELDLSPEYSRLLPVRLMSPVKSATVGCLPNSLVNSRIEL